MRIPVWSSQELVPHKQTSAKTANYSGQKGAWRGVPEVGVCEVIHAFPHLGMVRWEHPQAKCQRLLLQHLGVVVPVQHSKQQHAAVSDQSNPSSYKLHGAYSCKDRGTGPHVSTVPEDSILILNIILNIMVGSGTSGVIRSAQSLPIHTA